MDFELCRTKRKLRSLQAVFKITSSKADCVDASGDETYLVRERMKSIYRISCVFICNSKRIPSYFKDQPRGLVVRASDY